MSLLLAHRRRGLPACCRACCVFQLHTCRTAWLGACRHVAHLPACWLTCMCCILRCVLAGIACDANIHRTSPSIHQRQGQRQCCPQMRAAQQRTRMPSPTGWPARHPGSARATCSWRAQRSPRCAAAGMLLPKARHQLLRLVSAPRADALAGSEGRRYCRAQHSTAQHCTAKMTYT